MYNPDNQYRYTIIRTRAMSNMDDLLPSYAKIINSICPIETTKFPEHFNRELEKILPGLEEKTYDNHRTEMGKLFGIYYEKEQWIHCSSHTEKLLKDGDHPAFFKDICFKLQFPNGMDSVKNIKTRVNDGLSLRPCVYLIQFLKICIDNNFAPFVDEIGYYILNNLDVLQGKANPDEVFKKMNSNRKEGIKKKVASKGKASSFDMQHIKDLLSYMELANLIVIKDGIALLNLREKHSIEYFSQQDYKKLKFDIHSYSLETSEEMKRISIDYGIYMSTLAFKDELILQTPVEALAPLDNIEGALPHTTTVSTELGHEGEKVVVKYEKEEVKKWNRGYIDRVKNVASIKGLGYDVQSVRKEGDNPGQAIYIEVKSTKRITVPSKKMVMDDRVELTRNEWIQAEQSLDDYFIYRVYFTHGGIFIYKFKNPVEASKGNNNVFAEPIRYRIDFKADMKDCIKID